MRLTYYDGEGYRFRSQGISFDVFDKRDSWDFYTNLERVSSSYAYSVEINGRYYKIFPCKKLSGRYFSALTPDDEVVKVGIILNSKQLALSTLFRYLAICCFIGVLFALSLAVGSLMKRSAFSDPSVSTDNVKVVSDDSVHETGKDAVEEKKQKVYGIKVDWSVEEVDDTDNAADDVTTISEEDLENLKKDLGDVGVYSLEDIDAINVEENGKEVADILGKYNLQSLKLNKALSDLANAHDTELMLKSYEGVDLEYNYPDTTGDELIIVNGLERDVAVSVKIAGVGYIYDGMLSANTQKILDVSSVETGTSIFVEQEGLDHLIVAKIIKE